MEEHLFYHCVVKTCNRKYKTLDKYKKHISEGHRLEFDEENHIKSYIPLLKHYNKEKPKLLSIQNAIPLKKEKEDEDEELCIICYNTRKDTVVVPCGHCFCYSCIDEYYKKGPNQGCPMCRTEMMCITKIYK